MQSRTEQRFGPADVRLLEAFAGQAAVAIENAQLFEREHERRRQLEAVREVTAWLASETDLATPAGADQPARRPSCSGSERSAVFLWDEASATLIPRAWHGFGDWMGDLRIGLGEGVAGTVAQRRAGVIVDDYRSASLCPADRPRAERSEGRHRRAAALRRRAARRDHGVDSDRGADVRRAGPAAPGALRRPGRDRDRARPAARGAGPGAGGGRGGASARRLPGRGQRCPGHVAGVRRHARAGRPAGRARRLPTCARSSSWPRAARSVGRRRHTAR